MEDENSKLQHLRDSTRLSEFSTLYVVENLETGEKYVTDFFRAKEACTEKDKYPYYDIWTFNPKPNMKMYKLSDLGPAGEVLYGSKKP